jgi:vitamin B12 transporter
VLLSCAELLAETAQRDQEPLTIVITGSKIPVNDEQISSNTTVIKKQTIEQLNPRNVSQLLSSLPGLHVENSSARGSFNGLYLRGGDPNFTSVLINGVKVNDPTNSRGGAFDFSLLNINAIEQIEIVKGPVSSLYGSDAMAGVINIVTSQPVDDLSADIQVEAGTNELFNASAFAGNSFAKGNITLNLSYADDGEQITGSGFKSSSARLSGDYEIIDSTLLSMNFAFQDANAQSFPENSGGPEYAVIRDVDNRDTQQQVHYLNLMHVVNETNQVNIQFNYFQSAEKSDSVGIDSAIPPTINDSDYQRQILMATYSSKFATGFDTSIGAEMQWEEGESVGVIDPDSFNIPTSFNLDRSLVALFGELQYQYDARWRTYVGVRIDSPEEFSTETNPRVGISYQLGNTAYSIDWGKGFKLPSFYALAHPIIGNPNFKPETSESYQLAVLHKFSSKTEATLTAFWSYYYDLIDFDSTSNTLVQRSEVEINGVEIAIMHQFNPSLSIHFQYTAIQMDIIDNEAELLKRPDKTGGLSFNWRVSQAMRCAVSANYVGKINDFSVPTGFRPLDSYTRVDASLGWKWSKHWRSQLAVDNVLNEGYEEAIGFKAPGMGVRFSVTASL